MNAEDLREDEAVRIPRKPKKSPPAGGKAPGGKKPKAKRSLPRLPAWALIVGMLLLLLLIAAVIYATVFTVGHVTVVGCEAYGEEEIVAASGIVRGKTHLYSFNALKAADRISKRFPRVARVTIRRSAPASVTITVEEERAVYFADFYGETRMLSASMRVLEATTHEAARAAGLIRLLLPKLTRAVAGSALEFTDDREQRVISGLLSLLASAELADRVTGVDVRSIYDVKLVLDELYLAEIGSTEALDVKLRAVASLMRSRDFQRYGEVKLRIIVPENGSGAITMLPNAGMDLYE